MRRLFRYGLLAALLSGGLAVAAYMTRVRLAQYALERVLGDTGLIEARATVDSVTSRVVVLSDIVLVDDGWRIELTALRSVHDLWSLSIEEIRVDGGRLFVDVDRLLEAPSDYSRDELAQYLEELQFGMPEMAFRVESLRVDTVYAGRQLDLIVEGKGRVSSGHRLALSLEATGKELSLDVRFQSDPRDGAMRLTGTGRVADLARLLDSTLRAPFNSSESEGASDLDAVGIKAGFDFGLQNLRPVSFQVDVDATGLSGSLPGSSGRMELLQSSLLWTLAEGGVFEIFSEGFSLVAGDWGLSVPDTRIRGRIGETIVLPVKRARVRSMGVSALVDLEVVIPWPESLKGLPPGVRVGGSINRLITYGQGWAPVDFDFILNPESACFRTGRLKALGRNWPVLGDLEVTLPIGPGGPGTLRWQAILDLQVDPIGPISAGSGPSFSVSGEVSGLGSRVIRSRLRAETAGDQVMLQVGSIGYLDAKGTLGAEVEFDEEGRLSITSALGLEAIDLSIGSVEGRIERISAEWVLPPTPLDDLLRLSGSDWIERARFFSGLDITVEVIGDRLALPGGVVLEWFDFTHLQGPQRMDSANGPNHHTSLAAASLRVRGESLHNVEIARDVTVSEKEVRSSGRMTGTFEGGLVRGQVEDRLLFGENGQPVDFRGHLEFEPFEIRHSDVVVRHFPGMVGLSVSGQVFLHADARWTPERPWNLSLSLSVGDGALTYPGMNLRAEGIEGAIEIASLKAMRIQSPAVWTLKRMSLSDIEIRSGRLAFGFDGRDRLDVADLSFEAFEGRFHMEAFSYLLSERSADLQLNIVGLDVGRMLEELNFFEGSFDGSIDGSIPVSIRDGQFLPGYGRLELTPGVPAVFRYGAEGLFTGGEVAKSLTDRLRLLPLQLAEKGLGNIEVESLTVDLFDPETPLSPARIHMKGKAVADETEIPYVIDTNINGTVAEFLNFLLRLSSL